MRMPVVGPRERINQRADPRCRLDRAGEVRSQRADSHDSHRALRRSMPGRSRDVNPTPLRVLCVDDHRDTADSEAMLLELYGCEVAVSYDGASALAAALRFSPDVCLIDLNMPDMDGCAIARRLRAWRTCAPVYLIAVTAHGSEAARQQTARAGFDLHLVKPVDWQELARTLTELGSSQLAIYRAGEGE